MRVWLVVAAALLLSGGGATAAPAIRDVRLYWYPTADGEEYVLYRTRAGVEERVTLGSGEPCHGIRTTVVSFLRFGAYTMQLTAVGPEGESPRSNRISLPSCLTVGAPGCDE